MRLKRQAEIIRGYFNEFVEHRRKKESVYAIERLAQLLIQSMLDFGAMMALYMNLPKPESYKGIMTLLAEKLKLNNYDRKFLEQMAGFRNILVHTYASIDRELEEEAFKEMEDKLPRILGRLEQYIKEVSIDPSRSSIGSKLMEVFERYNVRFAFLFGSKARTGVGRDYDIAVSMDLKSLLELGGLLVDIADALGVNEELVDIMYIDTAPLSMIYSVLSDGILIYGDRDEALDFLYRKYLELLDTETLRKLLTFLK